MNDARTVRFLDVSYRYPRSASNAIVDATFEIGPREFVGVVGPNGGGKTTLMRLMLGLLQPRSGSVRMLGSRPAQVHARIGYVPQQARIDAAVPATVQDIVLMGRLERGSWGPRFSSHDLQAAREALEQTGTDTLADRPWATLSGGQRQRVLIARALAGEAEIVLLDEPTSGVDLHREQELLTLLHAVNQLMPVIMVSHDIALVQTHMDRALWVNRTVVSTPARELTVAAIERFFHGTQSCHPVSREAEQ